MDDLKTCIANCVDIPIFAKKSLKSCKLVVFGDTYLFLTDSNFHCEKLNARLVIEKIRRFIEENVNGNAKVFVVKDYNFKEKQEQQRELESLLKQIEFYQNK